LNHSLRAAGTFWLYAIVCLGGFAFIFRTLPETKGKSLERVEIEMQRQ
jgi:SP family sugar porter-like MFS transporter